MKKRIYSKKTKKPLKKTKSKTFKKKTKNMMKKKHLKKKTKIKSTRKNSKSKKQMKKVMKGGAIPFSELNPSIVVDHTFYGVTGGISGTLIDTAQSVPNNLSSGPSIFDQPYLDATSDGTFNVAGDSPVTHFARP